MTQKRPILIWRLKEAPRDLIKEDAFYEDEEGYRQWLSGKSGDEFIVMIPESYLFDDADIAYQLGLNVTEDMRSLDFSGPHNPNCEAFAHVNYEGDSYDVYVIPTFANQRDGNNHG